MKLHEVLAKKIENLNLKLQKDSWLEDALKDLKECPEEAAKEGFLLPTEIALQNTEQMLRVMFEILPRRYEVYPMSNGHLTVQSSNPPEVAIAALCSSTGIINSYVSGSNYSFHIQYNPSDTPLKSFLTKILDYLK